MSAQFMSSQCYTSDAELALLLQTDIARVDADNAQATHVGSSGPTSHGAIWAPEDAAPGQASWEPVMQQPATYQQQWSPSPSAHQSYFLLPLEHQPETYQQQWFLPSSAHHTVMCQQQWYPPPPVQQPVVQQQQPATSLPMTRQPWMSSSLRSIPDSSLSTPIVINDGPSLPLPSITPPTSTTPPTPPVTPTKKDGRENRSLGLGTKPTSAYHLTDPKEVNKFRNSKAAALGRMKNRLQIEATEEKVAFLVEKLVEAKLKLGEKTSVEEVRQMVDAMFDDAWKKKYREEKDRVEANIAATLPEQSQKKRKRS